MNLEDKDEEIQQVITNLQNEFGLGAFDIVDHWEADSLAIGIARPDNHGILVYIATYESDDPYFVSLETPPVNEDFPYQQREVFDGIDFIALGNVVKKHLSL